MRREIGARIDRRRDGADAEGAGNYTVISIAQTTSIPFSIFCRQWPPDERPCCL
jgi:hypothetical protein